VPKSEVPIWGKILAGSLSGAISSIIATPTDLVKVRMQTSGMGELTGGRSYPSILSAFTTIAREDGIMGLWKGV